MVRQVACMIGTVQTRQAGLPLIVCLMGLIERGLWSNTIAVNLPDPLLCRTLEVIGLDSACAHSRVSG